MEGPSSPHDPRRSFDSSNSPEFQFNHSFSSSTALLSADELFSGGVIVPLHLLPTNRQNPPPSSAINADPGSVAGSAPESDPSPSGITASKRWRNIFKKSSGQEKTEKLEKNNKKRDRKKNGGSASGSGGGNSTELNINLWPFSRSRSAGNAAAGRPRWAAVPARKASSAPCSRSNSAGESKSQRWPSSPLRAGGGVHLGRTSPVWQVPRPTVSKSRKEGGDGNRRIKAVKGGTSAGVATSSSINGRAKGRILSINVPMCIRSGHHLSCRSDETSEIGGGGDELGVDSGGLGGAGGANSGTVGSGVGNLFNLRSLFTKKVY